MDCAVESSIVISGFIATFLVFSTVVDGPPRMAVHTKWPVKEASFRLSTTLVHLSRNEVVFVLVSQAHYQRVLLELLRNAFHSFRIGSREGRWREVAILLSSH